jgi:hypothetical protein
MFPNEVLINYAGQHEKGSTFGTNIHQQVSSILPLRQEMERLGLLEYWLHTVLIVSSSEVGLHGDGADYSYSIVFPVWNTENTLTEFYESSVPPVDVSMEQEGTYFVYHGYDMSTCTLIDSVEILEPTIINTDTPHRVVHRPGSGLRMTAALRLFDKKAVENVLERIYA